MYQKVLISKSNEATFVCPKCDKTRTVDVSKYKHVQSKIKVKSRCICGYSWTSILERRRDYRVGTNIPCVCSRTWENGSVENIKMKIVDLSFGGLKLESDTRRNVLTDATFFKSPFTIDFHLGENKKIHFIKTVHPMHITKTHVGVGFDEAERGSSAIISYMLRQS
jgi:hypothetical protein